MLFTTPASVQFTTMRELDEALGSTGVEVVPDPRRSSRWRTVPRAIPGLALGYGTRENVWQLYRQLAERYVPGDRVLHLRIQAEARSPLVPSRGGFTGVVCSDQPS